MKNRGNGPRFVQPCELFERLIVGLQPICVATLVHANGSKLALSDGNLASITLRLGAADSLFVSSRRLVEPAQVEEAVASQNKAGGHHPLCASTRPVPLEGFESLPRLV